MCGFLNDPSFEKTLNLLINDLYLRWIEIVLTGYKKLSGLVTKINCDPSNSIEDPLISGDGFPFGKKFFSIYLPCMDLMLGEGCSPGFPIDQELLCVFHMGSFLCFKF